MHKYLTLKNAVPGGLIYCAGDTLATLISHDFYYPRIIAMLLLGATLYAIEIPAYFCWLDKRFNKPGYGNAVKRMMMAAAFFNPLWIARHLVFINLFSGQWDNLSISLLSVATASFFYCLPVALPVNYMIQNIIPLSWRFFASSVFSAVMAIYFAMSEVLFG